MYRHTRVVTCSLVIALFVAVPTTAQEGVEFNNHCRTCHSLKPNDNRMGPTLHNIFGAKAGAGQGYANYSEGLKTSGVTWDEATLDKFIANPNAVVPNNNMKPYSGIADESVRKRIVEFLKSQRG